MWPTLRALVRSHVSMPVIKEPLRACSEILDARKHKNLQDLAGITAPAKKRPHYRGGTIPIYRRRLQKALTQCVPAEASSGAPTA